MYNDVSWRKMGKIIGEEEGEEGVRRGEWVNAQ